MQADPRRCRHVFLAAAFEGEVRVAEQREDEDSVLGEPLGADTFDGQLAQQQARGGVGVQPGDRRGELLVGVLVEVGQAADDPVETRLRELPLQAGEALPAAPPGGLGGRIGGGDVAGPVDDQGLGHRVDTGGKPGTGVLDRAWPGVVAPSRGPGVAGERVAGAFAGSGWLQRDTHRPGTTATRPVRVFAFEPGPQLGGDLFRLPHGCRRFRLRGGRPAHRRSRRWRWSGRHRV